MIDYLIVGAGLFGVVFAREATDAGKKCIVIDRREHIAGNIHSKDIEDIQVHMYGPHIFHTDNEEVWSYVNCFANFNHFRYEPVANYKGQLYNLPFNMNTFHQMWGVNTPEEAERIIEKQREEIVSEPQNLEEQAIKLVGRDIYEKLIKEYTEKQWGRDCKDLPAFIIKRLPMRYTYDNNYFNDRYQGIPLGGYTGIVEKLLEGIEVLTGTDFYDFVKCDGDDIKAPFSSVRGDVFGRILYTGMIDEFFGSRLGTLEYRSLRFETEDLPDTDNYQGNAVVNYTEREVPYTRIIEHKHFEYGTGKGTIITREYPAEWKKGDEPYYPMNDEKNNALYEKYRALASECPDVLFGGRLGQYKYYNMDQVVREALDMSRNEK